MAEDQAKPEAPKVSKREELTQLAQAERQERAQRCHARIDAILKEENCQLGAQAFLDDVPGGGWVIKAKPGIVAL